MACDLAEIEAQRGLNFSLVKLRKEALRCLRWIAYWVTEQQILADCTSMQTNISTEFRADFKVQNLIGAKRASAADGARERDQKECLKSPHSPEAGEREIRGGSRRFPGNPDTSAGILPLFVEHPSPYPIKATFGYLPQLRANNDFLVVVVAQIRYPFSPIPPNPQGMLTFY